MGRSVKGVQEVCDRDSEVQEWGVRGLGNGGVGMWRRSRGGKCEIA